MSVYPFPKQKILASSNSKEIPDDNFKFNENGTKLSEFRKHCGKGEIARNE